MAENALPTTSNKWMAALNGSSGQINQGEEAFMATYFGRGAISQSSTSHEQEPLRSHFLLFKLVPVLHIQAH